MKKKWLFLLFIITFNLLSGVIYYVEEDGSGDFPTIQEAIESASYGDRIMVSPGIYYENLYFDHHDVIVASYYFTTDNEWYIKNTIIDGNSQGCCAEFSNMEDNTCQLNGFTLRNGSGKLFYENYLITFGGGILVDHASPRLRNLIIENNVATLGGGIYLIGSHSQLENLTIRHNYATKRGGGVYLNYTYNGTHNDFDFVEEHKCNVYLNYAGSENDICQNLDYPDNHYFMVDTLTILDYDYSIATKQEEYFTLDVEHGKIQPLDYDLYVSPNGNDNNSGMTPNDPLKTASYALTVIKPDLDNPKTIHILPGEYSPRLTGERFPLNCRDGVSIIGSGTENTILNPENRAGCIYQYSDNGVMIKSLSAINGRSTDGAFIKSNIHSSLICENIEVRDCIGEQCVAFAIFETEVALNNIRIDNCQGFAMVGIYSNPSYETQGWVSNVSVIKCYPNGLEYEYPDDGGGAIYSVGMQKIRIINCLVSDCFVFSDLFPKAFISVGNLEDAAIINTNIVDNTCYFGGGIFLNDSANLDIINSVFYHSGNYMLMTTGTPIPTELNVSYSLIENYEDGLFIVNGDPPPEVNVDDTVFDADPGFTGEDGWENYYQLAENSCCIDAGCPDTTGLSLPQYDLIGNPRINGDCIDIGCMEYFESGTEENSIPDVSANMSCYPNPITINDKRNKMSVMLISAGLPREKKYEELEKITFEIFNIKGQLVRQLDAYPSINQKYLSEKSSQLNYSALWDLKDNTNKCLGSGIYLILGKNKDSVLLQTKCTIIK